jgi:hypothetical protein
MAQNIEHRNKETVMQAFEFFDTSSFAVYMGRDQRAAFEMETIEDAKDKLEEYLDMIESSGNAATYTLRVYPKGTKNITTKTPSNGSTTFMLASNMPVKVENGITIIDRENRGKVGDTGYTPFQNMLIARIDKVENELNKARQENYEMQMKHLTEKMNAAISGVHPEVKDKTWWESIIETVQQNPNVIGQILNPLKDVVMDFMPGKKNYIVNPVSGTTRAKEPEPERVVQSGPVIKTEPVKTEINMNTANDTVTVTENETDQEDVFAPDAKGIRHNPFLIGQEKDLSEDERNKIFLERLERLNDDQMIEFQNAAIDSIADRITDKVLTRMLFAVAMMNDKDLNKLLNHLD